MTTELWYLALTATMTVLMWMPYGLELTLGQGVLKALGNRDDLARSALWADRARRAHQNAVENLVVFTALVLVAHAAGISNSATATAAALYFWMRLAHYVVYALGIIGVRTLVWAVAWVCQLTFAWQILL